MLATLAIGSPVLADKPAPPFSYKKVVPGGRYVFVMIAPTTVEEDVRAWNAETAAIIREIRKVYARSGLYRDDGSAEPLWTVEWYAFGVEVSSGGVHLIRQGPWAVLPEDRTAPLTSALDQEALSFFAKGELVRSYQIAELVSHPDVLPRSVSHFEWKDEASLDDARSEYTVKTKDGNRFVFNIRTGEIVSASRTAPTGAIEPASRPVSAVLWRVAAILGVYVLAFLVWLVVKRRRFRSQAHGLKTTRPGESA